MTLLITGGIIAIFSLSVFLFLKLSPQFGGKPSSAQGQVYQHSENFKKGKFVNLIPTSMDMGFKEGMKVMREFMKKDPDRKPVGTVPQVKLDSTELANRNDSLTRLAWFGHSAFLLEISGKRILLDPMLGDSPSPVPALASKRFSKELPIQAEKLPVIDAIVISHDHYDHLDYGSIQKLKEKTTRFLVPLGVAPHLIAWGISEEKIEELDWWQEAMLDDIKLACTPSRHFSGRGIGDRDATLWCSWVIQSGNKNIYFSGDGGYGPHFKEIGEKYGPFDLSLMECGQYNIRWEAIHMMPEQTVQAAIDMHSKMLMPIHWGAFTLSLHTWTDPVERSLAEAKKQGMPMVVPKIGETLTLEEEQRPVERWWEF